MFWILKWWKKKRKNFFLRCLTLESPPFWKLFLATINWFYFCEKSVLLIKLNSFHNYVGFIIDFTVILRSSVWNFLESLLCMVLVCCWCIWYVVLDLMCWWEINKSSDSRNDCCCCCLHWFMPKDVTLTFSESIFTCPDVVVNTHLRYYDSNH